MKNILILLFALFAVALKADDRTVPGRTLSVTPQNALIHLPEFRKRSYKVFIQDECVLCRLSSRGYGNR